MVNPELHEQVRRGACAPGGGRRRSSQRECATAQAANGREHEEVEALRLEAKDEVIRQLQASAVALRAELAVRDSAILHLENELCEIRNDLTALRAERAAHENGHCWGTGGDGLFPEVLNHLLALAEGTCVAVEDLRAALAPSATPAASNSKPTVTGGESPGAAAQAAYHRLVEQIRGVVGRSLPLHCTVLMVSKGDPELLKLAGRTAWHFPQTHGGVYAGHYPATSSDAIGHLEQLRRGGAEFLLFPSSALWWLDYYQEFRRHLEAHYSVVAREENTCLIYGLGPAHARGIPILAGTARQPLRNIANAPAHASAHLNASPSNGAARQFYPQLQELVESLLPTGATVLVVTNGAGELLKLGRVKTLAFPRPPRGRPSGKKFDSNRAVLQLEKQRAKGAGYLLIPSTAFRWLGRHRAFKDHLHGHYRLIVHQEHTAMLFALAPKAATPAARPSKLRKWSRRAK